VEFVQRIYAWSLEESNVGAILNPVHVLESKALEESNPVAILNHVEASTISMFQGLGSFLKTRILLQFEPFPEDIELNPKP